MFISVVFVLFCLIGAVSAADVDNVSNTEDSNLVNDNVLSLSDQNKLEISSEDSISETNIVNSHDDNLGSSSFKGLFMDKCIFIFLM